MWGSSVAATVTGTIDDSVAAVGLAQSDPLAVGIGVPGLCWLLAALLALALGLVLATRRRRYRPRLPSDASIVATPTRSPQLVDQLPSAAADRPSIRTTTSNDSGGVWK